MSSDFEDDSLDGTSGQPHTVASLRRTNDEMRTHIRQLKAELEQERNNSKRAQREKVTAVKSARDEEQERSQQAREELKRKLTGEHKEHMRQLQEALGREYENQSRQLIRQADEQLRKAKQQWEQEKAEAVRKARTHASSATRKELEAHFDTDKKGLVQELFELNQAKAAAEMRAKELQASDRSKAEEIRRMHEEHQNELAKLRRQAQQEHRRQIEEIQEKNDQLAQKEREVIQAKRGKSQVEMEKEQLEETLARIREGESWQRMSPLRGVLPGIGDASVTAPQYMKQYNDKEKQLILRNSELSNLARRLEERNTALTNENTQLSKRLQEAELANSPLEEKNKDLMKKYNRLIAKFRRLEDQNKHITEENHTVKTKHDQLRYELDQMTRKARRYSGSSKMAEQQKEELELLRLQTQEQMKSISELKQQLVEKTRRIELLQATKKNLLKEREECQAPTPTSQTSMLSLERVRAWDEESIASTVQEEVDQALFERDEMEMDFRQLQKEHLHLQRVFALRHDHRTGDGAQQINIEMVEELQQEKEALSNSNDVIANELELAWKVNEERLEKINELEQELFRAQEDMNSLQQELSDLQEAQELQKQRDGGELEQIVKEDELEANSSDQQQGRRNIKEETLSAGLENGDPQEDVSEKARLQQEVVQLQEAQDLLQQQAAEVEQQLKDQVAQVQQESGQLRADLQNTEQQLQVTADENVQLQERIRDLQLEKETDTRATQELEEKCATLQQKVDNFEAARDEYEERQASIEERLQRQAEQIAEAKATEVAQVAEQLQNELESKVAHYEQLLDKFRTHMTNMEQEKAVLQQSMEGISEEKEELSQQTALKEEEIAVNTQNFLALQSEVEVLRENAQRAAAILSPSSEVLTSLAKPVEQMMLEQKAVQQCITSLQRAAEAGRIPDVRKQLQKLVSHIPTVPVQLASLANEMEAMFGQPITPLRDALAAGEGDALSLSEDNTDDDAPPLPSSPPPHEENGRRGFRPMSSAFAQLTDLADSLAYGERDTSAELSALAIMQDMLKEKEEQLGDKEQALRLKMAECQQAVRQMKQLEQDLAVANAQHQQMQQRLETTQVQLLELQTTAMKLDALQQVYNDLQIEMQERRPAAARSPVEVSANNELQQELTDTKVLLEDRTQQLKQLERERDSLSRTNEALNSELLLLWRLVSLELRLSKKEGPQGSKLLEQRVRELELKLKDHHGMETTVAEVMERTGRLASKSSLSSLSDTDGHVGSLQRQLDSLTTECKSKEDFISHLQAEVARLTKTLSGNALDDMSSIHEEESRVLGNSTPSLASPRQTYSPASTNYGMRRRAPSMPVHSSHAFSRAEHLMASNPKTHRTSPLHSPRTHGTSPLHSPRTHSSSPGQSRYMSASGHPAQTLAMLQQRRASGPHTALPPQGRLYVTLFDYDPSLVSDADADAQLCVPAGSVVVVYGGLDSRGMYHAEYQGQHGLIPASFLEEVSSMDPLTKARLASFKETTGISSLASSRTASLTSVALSSAADTAPTVSDSNILSPRGAYQPSFSISSTASPTTSPGVPHIRTPDVEDVRLIRPAAPSQIHVERQLENNLLVAWRCPSLEDGCYSNGVQVAGYHIAVDDHVEILQGPERSKVLVENVDLTCAHHVSVSTLAVHGQRSEEVILSIPDMPSIPPHQAISTDGHVSGSPLPPTHGTTTHRAKLNSASTQPRNAIPMATHTLSPRQEPSVQYASVPVRSGSRKHTRGDNAGSLSSHHGQQTDIFGVPLSASPDQLNSRCEGTKVIQTGQQDEVIASPGQGSGHLAIALYDYPTEESPHHGGLSFQQGELVEVLASDSDPRFVIVSANGIQGKVPRSFVADVSENNDPLVLADSELHLPLGDQVDILHNDHAQVMSLPWYAKALYNYQPEAMSPRDNACNTELHFKRGDLMMILSEEDENGFLSAKLKGRHGLVPASFVEVTTEKPDEQAEMVHNTSGSDLSVSVSSVSSYASSELNAMSGREQRVAVDKGRGAHRGNSQGMQRELSVPVFLQQPEYLENGVESEEETEDMQAQSTKPAKGKQNKGLLNRGRSLISNLRSRRTRDGSSKTDT